MCETKSCIECRGTKFLHDENTGEIVCINCGLVLLQTLAFTPPPDRTSKHGSINPVAYTSISVGSEMDSHQYLEVAVTKEIEWIVPKLHFPHSTIQMAIHYMRKLRHNMRQHNPHKIRFTKTELTALSIWNALKQQNYPITYNEFTQQITPLIGPINLMKTQNRANYFINIQNRVPDTTLIIAHINKIANQLVSKQVINNIYANILNKYALQMIHKNPKITACRRAKIVAAAAILAADKLLANRLHLQPFAKLTNNGTGKLSSLTTTLKRNAPPLPKQCAAIKLNEYLTRNIDKELKSNEP